MDVEQRHNELGAKPKQQTPSQGQKDRSLQDIDKDIETIWNELQVLEGPSVTSKPSRYNNVHVNENYCRIKSNKDIFSVHKVLSNCQSLWLKMKILC